eukprot:TRINITY_DN3902_c0_g2_i1.p1 TRINITY_DN3902_c0_g2~~TRINITY_DN3902_c0_g2_i1.p1  ORF type:complete len:431 (-),score=94.90 TRINITY_DN3902_c0_g2_i1:125-1417(-)
MSKSEDVEGVTSMTQEEFDAALSTMTPEQIQYLSAKFLEQAMKERKVYYGGKTLSLWDLGEDMVKNEKLLKAGGGVDTLYNEYNRLDMMKLIPGEYMRQGRDKMQLRPKEEEMLLGLDLIGGGTICSTKRFAGVPYQYNSEFSFGIYAEEDNAKVLLEDQFAGKDPRQVLTSREYYQELVNNGPLMELTLMLFPHRDIPLYEAQHAFQKYVGDQLQWLNKQTVKVEEYTNEKNGKDAKGVKKNGKGKQEAEEVVVQQEEEGVLDSEFERANAMMSFPEAFQDVSWFDKQTGCIKKHSQFIFTCHRDGNVTVEAISPGKLSEKKTSTLGMFRSRPFTYSLFSTFMGPNSVNVGAQVDIGRAFLFVANGFSVRDTGFVKNVNRRVEGEPMNLVEEEIKASPDIFRLERVGRSPYFVNLLYGVRSRLGMRATI